MSRAQLALNVDDLDEAITFYSKLFNTAPAKVKPGYANFAVTEPPLKLVLIENPGHGGTLNHLGVEVESSDAVHAEIARLTNEGLFTDEEIGTTCCFATQDKVWVTGPAGEKWEVYTVLADSERSAQTRRSWPTLLAPIVRAAPERRATPPLTNREPTGGTSRRRLRSWRSCRGSTGSCRCGSASQWQSGLLLGRLVPGLELRAESRSGRRDLTADCARSTGDDVPGAGQGPLRPAGHRDRRPQAAGKLARPELGRRPRVDVRVGVAAAARSARLPHRPDHRRPGPLHRHGHHLERPRLR